MKKKFCALVAVCLVCLMAFAGCGKEPASSTPVTTTVLDVATISDEQMLVAVENATKALQENINLTDPTAVVELVINENGSCSVFASGLDDDGTAVERQELCTAESVKEMFRIYYENGWIDSDGNLTGTTTTQSEEGVE